MATDQDKPRETQQLLAMANACAGLDDSGDIIRAALPVLLAASSADSALVMGSSVQPDKGGLHPIHHAGLELDLHVGDLGAADPTPAPPRLSDATVPASWESAGIRRVGIRWLAGESVLVVLAWRQAETTDPDLLELGLSLLDAHLTRTTGTSLVIDRPADMQEFERRQALEINDNVVQGLVAASYALDQGQVAECSAYLNRTLSSARAMMDGMLEPTHGGGFKPGDLVRTAAATFGVAAEGTTTRRASTSQRDAHTVLVVDDADDLRMLLRARMESRRGLTVIGEAADGLAAVELASELQPDLVMLDLAMPRMDGLEALPLIRAAVPGVRVIVLSGFNQSTLAEKAMEAGADRYVVKGGSMRQLLDLVDTVLEDAS
jgi:CheY-like chemotaxis protein